jgi:PAS domain S-box-containing protein
VNAASADGPDFELTPPEQTWLAEHPNIRVGMMDAWPPLNFVDQRGRPQGIGADYVAALNTRLGGILVLEPAPFKENYEKVVEKRLDAILDITPKPEREADFNFTEPYIVIPHVIVGREDGPYFNSERDLSGKTVALERSFYNVTYFRTEYPQVSITEYDSTSAALDAVSRGEADAYAGNRAVALYIVEQELLANLRLMGRLSEPVSILTIGVRKDWPELAAILDKALASITREEKRRILAKWSAPVTEAAPLVALTPEQRQWLDAHPRIRVGIMESWPPMDFVDEEGIPRGMGVDFLEAINKRLDGRLSIVPGPWSEIYEKVRQKELDALSGITPTEEREAFFNFTKPYANIPHVIVARKGGPYYARVEDLKGKTVALERGFFLVGFLRENEPDIQVAEYASTSDVLDAVANGNADACVGNRAVLNYVMEKNLLRNLQVQGKFRDTASVNSIGVRKDWPELAAILDRALAALSYDEVRAIYAKWDAIPGAPERPSIVELTDEEAAWIDGRGPIIAGVDISWPPFEFIDEIGQYRGIASDIVGILEERTGLQFQVEKELTWNQVMEAAKRKELDTLTCLVTTPERAEYLDFTAAYVTVPVVVVMRDDASFISGIRDLETAGSSVAVTSGYATQEFMERDYPEANLVIVPTAEEGLRMVSSGEVDAYLVNLATTSYYTRQLGLTNLKVAYSSEYTLNLRFGVPKGNETLVAILNKGLASIAESQRQAILQKWISIEYEPAIDYSLVIRIALISLCVIGAVVYWNRSMAREIRGRKKAQAALQKSEKHLGAVVTGVVDAIITLDQAGTVASFNRAAEEIFGYAPDKIIGRNIEMLFPQGEPGGESALALLYTCIGANGEVTGRRKDGSVFPMDLGVCEMTLDDHAMLVAVARDITERKQAEEEIKRAREAAEQANRAKSTFLANMSHELRTPLNAILGYSEMLMEEAEDLEQEEFVPDLKRIHGAGNHLLALINDVLDLSKIEAGRMDLFLEEFDLSQMVDEIQSTVDTLVKKKNNTFALDCGEDLGQMYTDLTKVRQSLFNLLSNAAKFTEGGGTQPIGWSSASPTPVSG